MTRLYVAVLDSMRDGRSWIAESANISLDFTATSDGPKAGVGERLDAKANAHGRPSDHHG